MVLGFRKKVAWVKQNIQKNQRWEVKRWGREEDRDGGGVECVLRAETDRHGHIPDGIWVPVSRSTSAFTMGQLISLLAKTSWSFVIWNQETLTNTAPTPWNQKKLTYLLSCNKSYNTRINIDHGSTEWEVINSTCNGARLSQASQWRWHLFNQVKIKSVDGKSTPAVC